jgi:hypothetical protein
MVAHTACAKHSLRLDKILGEKKIELDERELAELQKLH